MLVLGVKWGVLHVTIINWDELIGIPKIQLCKDLSYVEPVMYPRDLFETIWVHHRDSFESSIVPTQW